jgi:hypothetical protein
VKWLPELVGATGGLGWVAVKAVLMFAVTIVGLRLGERRTLAQLGAFDFAVAVAIGAIIGRTVTASSASFATGAVALITLLGRTASSRSPGGTTGWPASLTIRRGFLSPGARCKIVNSAGPP